MLTDKPITAFISYSHDSALHREHVLGLAERLMDDGGIDVEIAIFDLPCGQITR